MSDPVELRMAFAKSINAAMAERRQTLRGLAKLLGIDKSAISRARRGLNVTGDTVLPLQEWLGQIPPNRDGVLEEAGVTDEMLERALRAYFPGYEWSLHKAMGDDVQRVVAAHMRAALTAALKTQDQEHA